jgi:hypothetical protein
MGDRVQQQILWLLDIFVSYSKTQVRIHISPACMQLIKLIVEKREHLISVTGTSVKVCSCVSTNKFIFLVAVTNRFSG